MSSGNVQMSETLKVTLLWQMHWQTCLTKLKMLMKVVMSRILFAEPLLSCDFYNFSRLGQTFADVCSGKMILKYF